MDLQDQRRARRRSDVSCFTPRSWRPKSLTTRGFLLVGLVLAVGVLSAGCSRSQAHSSPSTAAAVTEKKPAEAATPGLPRGFQPESMVSVPGAREVIVTGSAPCGRRSCAVLLSGFLGAGDMVHSWVRLAAPPIPPAENPYRLDLGIFSFANRHDGYEVRPSLAAVFTTRGCPAEGGTWCGGPPPDACRVVGLGRP